MGVRRTKFQRLGQIRKKRFTEFEKILDLELSKIYGDREYEREFVIGKYRLDFFFPNRRLGIEVDGGYHNTEKQKGIDEKKTNFCNKCDIEIIRFTNYEIKTKMEFVLSTIHLKLLLRKKLW